MTNDIDHPVVVYFTKELDWSIAKTPLNFNDGLVKLGLTSLVKLAADKQEVQYR